MRRLLASSVIAGLLLIQAGPALAVATTLNPADAAAGVVLSNGNLTITYSGFYGGARSTTSHATTGKYCYEMSNDAAGALAGAGGPGFATSTADLTILVGQDAQAVGWRSNDADVRWSNSSLSAPLGTVVIGSVFMWCVDLANKNVWIKGPSGLWDGSGTDNPTTNTGGINKNPPFYNGSLNTMLSGNVFVMISSAASNVFTVNFGATPFTNTLPTGFTAWDGAAATCGAIPLLGAGPC